MSIHPPAPGSEEPQLAFEDCCLLVQSVTDYAIFMVKPEGRIASWNAGAERIYGHPRSEILGQPVARLFADEDIENGAPERLLAKAAESGRIETEGWRQRCNGTRFWAHIVTTVLRSSTGQLRGFGWVVRDLTAERSASEQLRQSEERFRLLVDGIRDYAIYLIDPAGRITTWNPGAERMKGYRSEEVVGKHFSIFFSPEDAARGKPHRELEIASRVGRFEEEAWRVRKNGERFWANVVVTALKDKRNRPLGFAKVTRDLTARRKAEEAERQLLREQAARSAAETVAKRAEEANRIKDEFLATVSHELRTPLTAIVGWSTLLQQRHLDPTVRKGIDSIYRNAQAQTKLVEDILDVSRIVTGKLHLEPALLDLAQVTREAIEVVQHSATAKQIDIEFAPQDEAYPLVGDADRLRQAVWNLLSNAVKFTDPKGRISVQLKQERSVLVLSVTDTGRGIEAQFLPLVFDPFKQADASTTRRYGGLGLGLALVRHIAELHGGSVAVQSPGPGQGSTFTVTLPIRAVIPPKEPHRAAAPPAALPAETHGDVAGLKILVVDDEVDAQELVAAVLRGSGAEVETAGGSLQALDAVVAFQPDVIVSDVGMPDVSGYTFIQRLRQLGSAQGGSTPAVALTAYTRAEDRQRALEAGFDNHIGKPIEANTLITVVAAVARRSGKHQ